MKKFCVFISLSKLIHHGPLLPINLFIQQEMVDLSFIPPFVLLKVLDSVDQLFKLLFIAFKSPFALVYEFCKRSCADMLKELNYISPLPLTMLGPFLLNNFLALIIRAP